jgi:hypothetical protein
MRRSLVIVGIAVALGACAPNDPAGGGAEPTLAANAPKDAPFSATSAAMGKMLAPCVTQARAAFPDAEKRFKAGLPAGQSLFVVTVLRDSSGKFEQVFIAVDSIGPAHVYGRIPQPPPAARRQYPSGPPVRASAGLTRRDRDCEGT